MKKLTKRSILAVLALVLAVVTLGTTSYAWFTLGNTVGVEGFELNVQGGEGLEFAFLPADSEEIDGGLDWVSFISSDDLMTYLVHDYGITKTTEEESSKAAFARGFELDAVTSTDGVSFFAFNTDEDGKPSLSTDAVDDNKAAGVLEFKLAFRTIAKPTAEAPVNLIWSQATLKGETNKWTPEKPFTSSKGGTEQVSGEADYNVSDAARISVKGGQTGDVVVVYENAETATNTVLSNEWESNWNDLGAHSYYKEVTGHDLSTTFDAWENQTIQTVQSISDNKVSLFGSTAVPMGGTDYYTTSVTVRVYIEGFDLEAFNSILSQALQVALRFKLEVTTTP